MTKTVYKFRGVILLLLIGSLLFARTGRTGPGKADGSYLR